MQGDRGRTLGDEAMELPQAGGEPDARSGGNHWRKGDGNRLSGRMKGGVQ